MKFQQLIKATVLAGATLLAGSAFAVQIGPNPTKTSLEASSGPFSVQKFTVTRPSGYGAGTVYYPTNAGAKVGAIAIVPGYLSYQSSINWWGPRLASHGFVVITIDTYTTADQPASRSRQQLAAIDQVVALGNTSTSPIYNKVDGTRTGVMGWSMGGGGSLISTKSRPSIKAAAPQAPWATLESFSSVTVPTLIFSCQSDVVAPVAIHANSFYNEMYRNPKQLLEKTLGDHFCMNSANPTVGLKGVAWMKRFIDGDTRYTTFACSNPNAFGFSDFRTARCS
jgi:dienelactone hydrolase